MKTTAIKTVMTVLVALISLNANAYDARINGIYYKLDGASKTAIVTGRINEDEQEYAGTVTIPLSINYKGVQYSVTSIDEKAFAFCNKLTSIVIPNSVTSIGNGAFYWCGGLTSVTIPNSVTSIGGQAFVNCSSLTFITIPNSVTSIGGYAFDSTPWYNNMDDGVIYINGILYDYKGKMPPKTAITIKDGTKTIREDVFENCTNLTSITIPNSVTSIGNAAFSGCGGLASVTIPNSVTSIGERVFEGCSGLASVTIPNSVTSIGNAAFRDCANLTSIAIPNSVTSIGDDAFRDCANLTSIIIPNSVTSIGECSFWGCSGLTSVTIPNSVTSIGMSAFQDCGKLASITIPNSVTSIGMSAFQDCGKLASITIPNSVTSIGSDAFSGTLWYDNMDDGLIYNNSILYDYKGKMPPKTVITIKDGTKTIADDAFASCNELTSITIPNSVTSIGSGAFSHCDELTSITIPNSVTSIGSFAFWLCHGLTSITIPNSVISIGSGAFYECSNLASITIPNSVTSIGRDAFYGTPWYDNIDDGLIYINSIVYKYKGDMPPKTAITIRNGTKTIADGAFEVCKGLTSVMIPNSVTSIGEDAFNDCHDLTSITIPNSVGNIKSKAFSDCEKLSTIHCLSSNPPIICDDSFSRETEKTSTLFVPKGSIEAYRKAKGWKEFKRMGEEENENDEVFEIVEKNPSFPEGDKAQTDWIQQNMRYPQSAKKKNIQGRVIVQVIVNKDGSIVEPKVLRSVDPDLDKEAIRLVSSMPKWIPGKNNGKEVRVHHSIVITFRLN